MNTKELTPTINIYKLTKTPSFPSKKIGRDLEAVLTYINQGVADLACQQ